MSDQVELNPSRNHKLEYLKELRANLTLDVAQEKSQN